MNSSRGIPLSMLALMLVLGGCATATRPINPPITQADPRTGYRFETRQAQAQAQEKQNLVVLAFSGGGTRAAAFSYGVLEFLRRTEVTTPKGKARLLDAVDVITGVSGGSFTALAYGLYGDKLFTEYEQRFLKRDVQGEIVSRTFSPANWGRLGSTAWGRSELASELYDEILFNNATFADLNRGKGPLILASATDISTGSRFVFNQRVFDVICSDLKCRAALARRGGLVGGAGGALARHDQQLRRDLQHDHSCLSEAVPRRRQSAPARRTGHSLAQGGTDVRRRRPSTLPPSRRWRRVRQRGHARACSMRWRSSRRCTKRACHRRSTTRAESSSSSSIRCRRHRPTGTSRRRPPGTVDILLKAAGTPIDAFSYEAVELLKDTAAHWQTLRRVRNSAAFAANKDPAVAAALRVPDAEIYAIDVSFPMLKDKAELDYLNQQPTSFVLPPEAVDRLRAAAGTIIMDSPEFKRLLKDVGARVVEAPPAAGNPATAP